MGFAELQLRPWAAMLVAALLCAAPVRAEDPAAPAAGGERPKTVRMAGGERGPQAGVRRVDGPASGTELGGSADREKLREKFRAAHEAIKRAREQAQANSADPNTRARVAEDPAKAEENGQDEAAAQKGGEDERLERSRHARHLAWRGLMHQYRRPSEIPPDVRNELRQHARRIARIARIRALAQQGDDRAALARADKLLARELERHQKKMRVHAEAAAQAKAAEPSAAQPKPAAAEPAEPDDPIDNPDPEGAEEEAEEGAEP